MEHLRQQWRSLARTASTGTYWRVHNKNRPFEVGEAHSLGLGYQSWDDEAKRRRTKVGFSCIDNPWHLWFYCVAMGWHADGLVQNSWVIEFSGRPVTQSDLATFHPDAPADAIEWMFDEGRGDDNEDLVMPDMRTVNKSSWADFERMLIRTPLPSESQGLARVNPARSWAEVAEMLVERKTQGFDNGPVVNFLTDKFSKVATLNDYWVMVNGEPRWQQPHDDLLRDALYSWKGSPSSIHIHMDHAERNDPLPDSGSGKIMRAWADSLIVEMGQRGRPTPKLYRGDHLDPTGRDWACWSESKAVARRWAKMNNGLIWTLPAGSGRGLRLADYIKSGLDETEKEWVVVSPTGATPEEFQ